MHKIIIRYTRATLKLTNEINYFIGKYFRYPEYICPEIMRTIC